MDVFFRKTLFKVILICLFVVFTRGYSFESVGYYQSVAENATHLNTPSIHGPCLSSRLIPLAPKITTLNYAFMIFHIDVNTNPFHVTDNWGLEYIVPNGPEQVTRIMALKDTNPNLKIFFSVGGWEFGDTNTELGAISAPFFSEMVTDPEKRAEFIDSVVLFIETYGFDGIDLDWEYPGQATRGGQSTDYDNYLIFLDELRTALPVGKLITSAVPPFVPNGLVAGTYNGGTVLDPTVPATYFAWQKACEQYLDWFNVMGYDLYGPWDPLTGELAPLFLLNAETQFSVDKGIQSYLDADVPANKMTLGMPIYGRTFAGVTFPSPIEGQEFGPLCPFVGPSAPGKTTNQEGYLAYYEIVDQLLNPSPLAYKHVTFNPITKTCYAYSPQGKSWVSFDLPDDVYAKGITSSVAVKCEYIREKGLLGAMVWPVDNDIYWDNFPYMTTIYNHLLK